MDKIIEFLYKLHLFLIIIILIDKIRLRFEGNIMKQRDIQVLIISANHDIEKMLKKVVTIQPPSKRIPFIGGFVNDM